MGCKSLHMFNLCRAWDGSHFTCSADAGHEMEVTSHVQLLQSMIWKSLHMFNWCRAWDGSHVTCSTDVGHGIEVTSHVQMMQGM